MKTNIKEQKPPIFTHEGGLAKHISEEQQLRRSVMSCLLWEKEFYEDGVEIAQRITDLALKVRPDILAEIAVEARNEMHLRHVPLLLLSVLAKTGAGGSLVRTTIPKVIRRADELAEFLSVHAKRHGVAPSAVRKHISAQMKKGLAAAFASFDEYQLAKYNRDGAIKLRDVMFLTHPKAGEDLDRKDLYAALAENKLATPDTWEVALSGGADKKETFTRLLTENKLGYFALLRNLRNMMGAGVDQDLIEEHIRARRGAHNILPFRYIAAARAVPQLERALDDALIASVESAQPLPGTTAVLVDISGSMDAQLSGKSDLKRIDAAAALASVIPGKRLRVFSFSDHVVEVPARKGMAGVDAIIRSQGHSGTELHKAILAVNREVAYDRLIVISDEQAFPSQHPGRPNGRGYMINVASNKNGIGYGGSWVHLDGFSEAIIRYIAANEGERLGNGDADEA